MEEVPRDWRLIEIRETAALRGLRVWRNGMLALGSAVGTLGKPSAEVEGYCNGGHRFGGARQPCGRLPKTDD